MDHRDDMRYRDVRCALICGAVCAPVRCYAVPCGAVWIYLLTNPQFVIRCRGESEVGTLCSLVLAGCSSSR